MSKQSYYYNKYIEEIKDAIIDGKRELNFKDGNCDIIIKIYYKDEDICTYHKSPSPYEIPSEVEHSIKYSNIIVEIETFEEFTLPDIIDTWTSFE